MKNKVIVILACSILLSFGCAEAPKSASDDEVSYKSESMSDAADYEAEAGSIASNGVSENMVSSSVANDESITTADGKTRQLIKTANASFHVKDVYKAAMTLEDMTTQYGGFVTHNQIENRRVRSRTQKTDNGVQTVVTEYRPEAQLTLRVPQAKLQAFLRDTVTHVEFMYSRNFNAEDVLLEITKQQQLAKVNAAAAKRISKAGQKNDELGDKVSAIDSGVMYQANKVLADIEKAALADKVAFSTLSLQLEQSPIVRTHTENHFAYAVEQARPSFWYRLEESVEAGWEHFLSFLVGFASLWPFMLLISGLYFIWRGLRDWWRRRKLRKANSKNNK